MQAGQVIQFDTSELTDTHHPGVIAIGRYLTDQLSCLAVRTDLA